MGNRKSTLQNDVRTDIGVNHTITIFMPITRIWRVAKIAEMLYKLDIGDNKCELLVCIDTTEITESYVEAAFQKWELPFKHKIIHTRKHPVGEVNMASRRNRIKEMLEFSKPHIGDTDFVFMVEDDSDINPDAMLALLGNYENLTKYKVKVGFVEGVQVGRHGYRMIGAWRVDDLHDPKVMQTIPFTTDKLLEKIDGGGLYCFITPTKLFKAHKWYWEHECFSVDVTYGIELRKQGYTNIIDWSVTAGHAQQDGSVLMPNENCTVVRYEKQPEGHWNLIPKNKRKGYIS